MHSIFVTYNITLRNIYKWCSSPKVISLSIFICLFVFSYLHPIKQLVVDTSISITPWVFPYLSSDPYMQIVFLLGSVLLFCDAPFFDSSQIYVLQRCGKTKWGLGQLFYILLSSIIYTLYTVFLSIVSLLPNLVFHKDWGKIIGTLALTDAVSIYRVPFSFSSRIFYSYTPQYALFLSVLLFFLLVFIIGLIQFIFNSIIHKSAGSIINCLLIMFNYFISAMLPSTWYSFSPMALGNLALLQNQFQDAPMSLSSSITSLSVIVLILFTCSIIICCTRKDFLSSYEM